MYKAKVKYRGDDEFLLVIQRINGWSSDGLPMSREKTEMLLECVLQALKSDFAANDLSGGDWCRFIGLPFENHFLLSINVNDIIYKGYDLSINQVKLLKASLKNVIAEADEEGQLDG